jgi:hypothetical protein
MVSWSTYNSICLYMVYTGCAKQKKKKKKLDRMIRLALIKLTAQIPPGRQS